MKGRYALRVMGFPFGGLVEVQAASKPETDMELAEGRLNSNGGGLRGSNAHRFCRLHR